MISNGSQLVKYIDTLLKPAGYIRKGDTWYKKNGDMLYFISIGKSPYSGKYENAIGLFLIDLIKQGVEYPPYHHSGFRFGIDKLADKELIIQTFNLENTAFHEQPREKKLKIIFENIIIPFFDEIKTKNSILNLFEKYPDLKYHMMLDYKEFLGI